MKARGPNGRRTATAMTLLEVLAAIFILGMGLIMVAGAFPVGEDQTARAVRLTETGMLGRSAIEICRAQRYIRTFPANFYREDTNRTRPRGKNNEPWRIWNPDRWANRLDMDESKLWPPEKGDILWRAFLTRLSGLDEAPLFRLTVVIAKFDYDRAPEGVGWYRYGGWELYNPQEVGSFVPHWPADQPDNDGDNSNYIQAGVTTRTCSGASGRKMAISSSFGSQIRSGDYVMDMRTGLCYQIERFFPAFSGTETAVLASDPVPPFPGGQFDFIFLKSVQAIYTTTWSE